MVTLASQAEIGVWVQAQGPLLWGYGGITPGKKFEIVSKILQYSGFCGGRKMVRNSVHEAFLNTLTVGSAFPRVPLEMTPEDDCRHEEMFSNSQVTSRKADASGATPRPFVGRHVYHPASFLCTLLMTKLPSA